jgi:hypothetical protein
LATVVLFQVIKGNETSIRDGWNHVCVEGYLFRV